MTIKEKAFVVLDGTPAADRPHRCRHPYYSAKRIRHGMNVQVLTDPAGRLLWAFTSPARID